ncbi:hypothetical protein GGR52DRAFT_518729 [Hypoxylon sp. FL1284]|nr:hypothetical protein GGR52DRAFT_518729 [Hypoxylon sp. FL1284]
MQPETCSFVGRADVYGFGIRIGVYLQWYGVIFAQWLAPTSASALRRANAVLVGSVFISLITLRDALAVPETYVALLLVLGSAVHAIPEAALRCLARVSSRRHYHHEQLPQLLRFTTAAPRGPGFGALWGALVIAALVYAFWFWFARVPDLGADDPCPRYGFLFARVRLDGFALFAVDKLLLFVLFVAAAEAMAHDLRTVPPRRARVEAGPSFQRLRLLGSLTELYVAVVFTIAIEVSIVWNGIRGVSSVDTAAQLIPAIFSVIFVLNVFCVFLLEDNGDPLAGLRDKMRYAIHRPAVYLRIPEGHVHDEAAGRGDGDSVATSINV